MNERAATTGDALRATWGREVNRHEPNGLRRLGAAVVRSAMIAATLHMIESPTRERAEEAKRLDR
ncbi:MAG: hypothetical protein HBSAPP02_30050 [Phycisphaerae bacterium]|nr:MAG: hypothetical protein HRU71_09545 [Planctomycetia bacterium]RIK69456.1 MAG: hypothetical protein DCC66_08805 [Planctomycetota bacterium]GJQ27973.1 MAG: hypothetical protein HBSAPP02_30050 [Phycisphaerae bacterium]